jgi:hypothetical protein
MIKRIQLGSVDKPGGTKILYVLLIGGDDGMSIEEIHKFGQRNENDKVNIIKHENWHKYEVNGIPLVLLIDRKMSEVPPT